MCWETIISRLFLAEFGCLFRCYRCTHIQFHPSYYLGINWSILDFLSVHMILFFPKRVSAIICFFKVKKILLHSMQALLHLEVDHHWSWMQPASGPMLLMAQSMSRRIFWSSFLLELAWIYASSWGFWALFPLIDQFQRRIKAKHLVAYLLLLSVYTETQ